MTPCFRTVALGVLGLMVAFSVPVHADTRDDALRSFKLGMALIEGGEHLEGARRLERAYELLPHPDVLYNIGLAYADAAEFDLAIDYFRRYLDTGPEGVEAVQQLLVLLGQRRAEIEGPSPGEEAEASELAVDQALNQPAPVDESELRQLLERLEEVAELLAPSTDTKVPPTVDAIDPQALEARSSDMYEEVIVSASRQATTPANAPVATTIISADELRLSGKTNIPDLLRRVPGISILTMGAGNANLAVRGFNQRVSNKLLTLVDGRSVYLDFLGATFFRTLTIDLLDIERIEVIRGPGSTLYGANAFGGVINIITRPPGGRQGGLVHLTAGSGESLIGNIQYSGRGGILGYRASIGYEQANRFEREYGERADIVTEVDDVDLALRTLRANAGLTIVPSQKASVGLSFGLSHFQDTIFALGLFRDFWIRGIAANGRVDASLGRLKVRGFWNHFNGDAAPTWQPYGGLDLSTEPVSHVGDVEASYSGTAMLGVRHDVVGGGGYRVKSISWDYLDEDHIEQHLHGFLEDRITFVPQLVGVLGFRFDQHPLVGFTPSPRGAVLIKPTPGQAIRFSTGTAFRSPTFLESYLDLAVPTGVVTGVGLQSLGSTSLRPEGIFSVEAGYVFEDSDFVSFEVSGYYERVSDLIGLGAIEAAEAFQRPQGELFLAGSSTFENADAVFHGWGAEVGIHAFPVDGLDIRATYSFSYFLDQEKMDAGLEDVQDRRHPMHSGHLGVSYRAGFGLSANVNVDMVSSVVVPERSFVPDGTVVVEDCAVPAYAQVSARLGYRLLDDRLEVGVTGLNLEAWKTGGHREHCLGSRVGPRVLGSATYRF